MKTYEQRAITQKESKRKKKEFIVSLILSELNFKNEEILEEVKSCIKGKNPRGLVSSLINSNPELVAKIILRTKYIKKDYFNSIPERVFHIINNLYEALKKGDTTSDGWFYNRQIDLKPQMIEHLATLGYEVENKITCGYDDVSYYYTSIRVKPSSSSKKRKQ